MKDTIKLQINHHNGKKYIVEVSAEHYKNKCKFHSLYLHKTLIWQSGSQNFVEGNNWCISTCINGHQLCQGKTKKECIKQFNLLVKRYGKLHIKDKINSKWYDSKCINLKLGEAIQSDNYHITYQ